VLPVLHLNGAKISGPTVLARKDPAEVRSLLEGHGYRVLEVTGDDVPACTCGSRLRSLMRGPTSGGSRSPPG